MGSTDNEVPQVSELPPDCGADHEDAPPTGEAPTQLDGFVEGLQKLLAQAVRAGVCTASGSDPRMIDLLETVNANLESLLKKTAAAAAPDVAASADTEPNESPQLLAEIRGRLDDLCEAVAQLQTSASPPPQEAAPPWTEAFAQRLSDMMAQRAEAEAVAQTPPTPPPPVQAETVVAAAADNLCQTRLEKAIFGDELAANEDLALPRQRLLDAVLRQDPAACNFAGVLLTFQAADTDRQKKLLSDVGEAFYAWRPQAGMNGQDPLERSLAGALNNICGESGLGLRIETVHVGDRFESAQHQASNGKGRQVTRVQGWIVVREGKAGARPSVFSRASVEVK